MAKTDSIARLLALANSGGSSSGGSTATSNYLDLINKPQINGVVLEGNVALDKLGIDFSLDEVLTKTNSTTYTPVSDYNPATKKYVDDEIAKLNIGDTVIINGPLYTNSNAASPAGNVTNKVTKITRKVTGAHPYNTTGDLGWMDESSIKAYTEPAPQPAPAPAPTGLQVGDRVKIIGTGNGSSYGDSNTAYGIGWERQILGIYNGRPFPYRVGNASATTGFYKESSLQKL